MIFNKDEILKVMEGMRRSNGAFIASPTLDYNAMWLRDTLYANYAYWYLGEYEKLKQGMAVVFDIFRKYQDKIKRRIASPEYLTGGIIHAKYHPDTLIEVHADEGDRGWGHHQLDTLGLFLHIVADLNFKNIRVIRDAGDLHIIELIVYYLRSVEYWYQPDLGMWEECNIRHTSSLGAVVDGLKKIRDRGLFDVPKPLILYGKNALQKILPYESRDECSRVKEGHNHNCDAAQLSLIWPYNVVSHDMADELLKRILGRLVQPHGLNRYWGDNYRRSGLEGGYVSAEWPMFYFWISIIFSQRHDVDNAIRWFEKGCKEIVNNTIPEAYRDGRSNDHTPLAWAHAIALIAWTKLPAEYRLPTEPQTFS